MVMGHLYVPESQPGYWLWARTIIYMIHMPLFMLLAGFLYGMHEPRLDTMTHVLAFVKKKAGRLMVPYFVVTCIMITVKYIAALFAPLRHGLDENVLYYAILNPMGKLTPNGGFATFLWFIYTLFIIFLLFPILRRVFGAGLIMVFVALGLSIVPWPKWFCLNLAFQFMPIFAFGFYLTKRNGGVWPGLLPATLGALGFLTLAYVGYVPPENDLAGRIIYIIRGLCGSLFLLHLVDKALGFRGWASRLSEILETFGRYSSGIYLMHILAMGPFTIFFYNFLTIGPSQFLFAASLIWSLGLLGPIAFERYVIRRRPILARLILGSAGATLARNTHLK